MAKEKSEKVNLIDEIYLLDQKDSDEEMVADIKKKTDSTHQKLSQLETQPLHVAVYSFGGLISEVKLYNDRDKAIEEMNEYLDEEGFDAEVDDARIFQDGEEVFSYSLPSERESDENVDELMDEYNAGTRMSDAEADEAAADLMDEE